MLAFLFRRSSPRALLIVSPIWLRHFHFGPLQWLWRALTYGTPPPLRRAAA